MLNTPFGPTGHFPRKQGKKEQAANILDHIEELKRESEALAEAARRAGIQALIAAAIAAAGGFGSAAKALRLILRFKLKNLSRNDVLSLVPVIGGGIAAGISAYDAVKDIAEARRLARQAEREQIQADRLGDNILRIVEEYRRAGCGADQNVS